MNIDLKMFSTRVVLLLFLAAFVRGQRPFFAGSRPIGYPELSTTTTAPNLGDRFGEDNSTTSTTQRLPIEALGDKDLVDRLSKLPIDKQPFWFINWQNIEANNKKPQTYPQKPNTFAQPIVPEQSSSTTSGNPTLNPIRNANIQTDAILSNRFTDLSTNLSSSEKPNINNFGSTNLSAQKPNDQKFTLPVRGNIVQTTSTNFSNPISNVDDKGLTQYGINSKPQKPVDAHNYNRKDFHTVVSDADKMYLNTFAHKTNENTDVKPSDIFKQVKPASHGNRNVKDRTKNGKPNVRPSIVDADFFQLYRDDPDYEGDFFDYLHAPHF